MKTSAFKIVILLTTFLLLLSACDGSGTSDTPTGPPPDSPAYDLSPLSVDDSYFVYDMEYPGPFAVDENGTLYAGSINRDNKTVEHPLKTDWQPEILFTAYNLNGEITAKYGIDIGISDLFSARPLATGGGKLYFSTTTLRDGESVYTADVIYTLDLASHDAGEFALPITLSAVRKFEYYGNKIYILAEHPDYGSSPFLAILDIASGDFEIVYQNLDNFSLKPDGGVLIAATDRNICYFAELAQDTWQMNDPVYIDIGIISSMAADGQGVFFTTTSLGGKDFRSFGLGYAFLNDGGGTMAVIPGNTMVSPDGGSIVYNRGLCWFIPIADDGSGIYRGTLERFRVSDYVNKPREIKMLRSFAGADDDHFGSGYLIDRTHVKNEEMALAMLSQDKTYDVFLVSAKEVFAHNIREKGSFYPLNGVPGVREYIDACFPFIQDAATDDEGNIWMLPVLVNANCIVVHPENAIKAGLDIRNAETPLDVMRFVSDAHKARSGRFYLRILEFKPSCLLKYLRETDTLDTPEFRAFAEELRELMKLGDLSIGTPGLPDIFSDTDMAEILFSHCTTSLKHMLYSDLYDVYDVMPVTGTSGSPSASCEFLVVNPYSDNLDTALEFISSVSQYLSTTENSFMFADPDTYTGSLFVQRLYALYEGSTIDFNIPYEVCDSIFADYLTGRTSLDAMVKEADRMIAMYLGE